MSKINKVLKHLSDGKSITGIEALKLYGLYRLSDTIFKLKNQGWNIKTVMVEGKDCRYARYYLSE